MHNKISLKNIAVLLTITVLMISCDKKQQENESVSNTKSSKDAKKIEISKSTVYTTATNSDLKLV